MIVNGDDFGLSSGVNRAIIKAHREGILTSASLMVNECAVDEAVHLALENPSLAVGLHLTLVLGHSALPHSEIPHLVDEQKNFTNSSFQAGIKYYFNRTARRELKQEMRAQFERFKATGLPFSHVDGHTHLHMHPTVFSYLIELCEEFNVRRVRIVRDKLNLSLKLDRTNLMIKLVWGVVFNLLANHCERQLIQRGFTYPPRVYGLFQTGKMHEDFLLKLIPQIEKVPSEIYAHPLMPDADSQALLENPDGTLELQALLSPKVINAFRTAGFELATYANL